MARVDSLIWLLMGFAQLLIGKQLLAADPTMALIGALLQGTGGSSVMLGIYFLIFLTRHQKEFKPIQKLKRLRYCVISQQGN